MRQTEVEVPDAETEDVEPTAEQREVLLGSCLDDIDQLESVLGESFDDWRSTQGRGSFSERAAVSPAQPGASDSPTS